MEAGQKGCLDRLSDSLHGLQLEKMAVAMAFVA
jgi:hypothetical protein